MRISDWSSDVCSSDLQAPFRQRGIAEQPVRVGDPGIGVAHPRRAFARARTLELGRASCRERVCPYVYISVHALSLTIKLIMTHFVVTSRNFLDVFYRSFTLPTQNITTIEIYLL